jgi:hypothetical protein
MTRAPGRGRGRRRLRGDAPWRGGGGRSGGASLRGGPDPWVSGRVAGRVRAGGSLPGCAARPGERSRVADGDGAWMWVGAGLARGHPKSEVGVEWELRPRVDSVTRRMRVPILQNPSRLSWVRSSATYSTRPLEIGDQGHVLMALGKRGLVHAHVLHRLGRAPRQPAPHRPLHDPRRLVPRDPQVLRHRATLACLSQSIARTSSSTPPRPNPARRRASPARRYWWAGRSPARRDSGSGCRRNRSRGLPS